MKEIICEKHGKYMSKVINILGKEIVSSCPVCKKEYDEKEEKYQKRKKEIEEIERILAWIKVSNLPEIYRNIENINLFDNQKSLEKFDFKKNLIIYGGVGTGKTMIASYLGLKAIKNNMTVRYLFADDLEKKVKTSWKTNLTEQDILNIFIDCDLLILDEIGRVEYNNYLFKLFDGRYTKNKQTIIMGNIEITEIPKILGEAIASRLRSNVKVVCFGTEDFRGLK